MNKNNIDPLYKTLNILCVEDDKEVLDVYKALFSVLFKEVYYAENGQEGFAAFKRHSIDVVLTDYQMPRLNGLEMSKRVREVDTSVPIIMVTALESMEMLRDAIDINITAFLKKPFTSKSLLKAFNLAVKSVVADRYMMQESREKLLYNAYQENLTFDKEKIITKNDIQESESILGFHCEVFYKPKDILSGDSYSIKEITKESYLLFIVDGMGKGISASVTAMMCNSFVNYFIEHNKKIKKTFLFEDLLEGFLEYIQPNLLEYEVVSASFLFLHKEQLQYAIFSMPPPLYMLAGEETIYKIKSNNLPLASYTRDFSIKEISITDITKLLLYSDGLSESQLTECEALYTKYLKDDFKNASSASDLEILYQSKVSTVDDDRTYIMLTKEDKRL